MSTVRLNSQHGHLWPTLKQVLLNEIMLWNIATSPFYSSTRQTSMCAGRERHCLAKSFPLTLSPLNPHHSKRQSSFSAILKIQKSNPRNIDSRRGFQLSSTHGNLARRLSCFSTIKPEVNNRLCPKNPWFFSSLHHATTVRKQTTKDINNHSPVESARIMDELQYAKMGILNNTNKPRYNSKSECTRA